MFKLFYEFFKLESIKIRFRRLIKDWKERQEQIPEREEKLHQYDLILFELIGLEGKETI